MTNSTEVRTGSCLCGSVRYRVTGPMRPVVTCHCGQCRKQSGHYVAATNCDTSRLELLSSEGLKWYRSSDFAERGFCENCGSSLFWRADGRGTTSIMAGTLDGETGLATVGHIMVAHKSDYYEITDDLPRIEGDDVASLLQPG